jgi:hypothetical protein
MTKSESQKMAGAVHAFRFQEFDVSFVIRHWLFDISHSERSRHGRSFQTIRNGSPFMGFGEGFDDYEFRAGFVALMQLGINGAGEGIGIVWDDGNAAIAGSRRNAGVGDNVDGGWWMVDDARSVMRDLGLKIKIVRPGEDQELGVWGIMFGELAGAFENV